MRWLVLSAAVTLAACQTTDYAQERIPLSPAVKEQFKRWQAYVTPLAFVVSTDGGSAAWSYCPEFGGCATSQLGDILSRCKPRLPTGRCVVYGMYGNPVVDDPELAKASAVRAKTDLSFPPLRSNRAQAQQATPTGPATITQVLPEPRPPAAPPVHATERLATLKDLRDRKLITPAEYEAKRKEILDGL